MDRKAEKEIQSLMKRDPSELGPEEQAIVAVYLAELERQEGDDTSHRRKPQRIEVAHKQGLFIMPDGSSRSDLEVVIVLSRISRQFWSGKEEGAELLCFSNNGKKGRPTDKGKAVVRFLAEGANLCEPCEANMYMPEGGKPCKEMRKLLVFHKDFSGALVLTVPPTSIRDFDTFYSKMSASRTLVCGIWTKITLAKQVKGSYNWSTLSFAKGPSIPGNQLGEILKIRELFSESVEGADEDDYISPVNRVKDSPEPFERPSNPAPEEPPLDDDEVPF